MVHEGGRMLHGDRMQCGHQSHTVNAHIAEDVVQVCSYSLAFL